MQRVAELVGAVEHEADLHVRPRVPPSVATKPVAVDAPMVRKPLRER